MLGCGLADGRGAPTGPLSLSLLQLLALLSDGHVALLEADGALLVTELSLLLRQAA